MEEQGHSKTGTGEETRYMKTEGVIKEHIHMDATPNVDSKIAETPQKDGNKTGESEAMELNYELEQLKWKRKKKDAQIQEAEDSSTQVEKGTEKGEVEVEETDASAEQDNSGGQETRDGTKKVSRETESNWKKGDMS